MTKSELVELARDGDRDAYDVLMTQVIDHLYRIARLILRDFDSAEDAVQEALVRCWRDLPRLREPDRFDAWLNRILLHAVTDEARRRRGFNANVTRLRSSPPSRTAPGRSSTVTSSPTPSIGFRSNTARSSCSTTTSDSPSTRPQRPSGSRSERPSRASITQPRPCAPRSRRTHGAARQERPWHEQPPRSRPVDRPVARRRSARSRTRAPARGVASASQIDSTAPVPAAGAEDPSDEFLRQVGDRGRRRVGRGGRRDQPRARFEHHLQRGEPQ